MKTRINFVIDALMFLCLMVISGIGFLDKYVLVPGNERMSKYGADVGLTWLGLDRHEWGSIHYYFGIAMLFLLVLHIVFHWKISG